MAKDEYVSDETSSRKDKIQLKQKHIIISRLGAYLVLFALFPLYSCPLCSLSIIPLLVRLQTLGKEPSECHRVEAHDPIRI